MLLGPVALRVFKLDNSFSISPPVAGKRAKLLRVGVLRYSNGGCGAFGIHFANSFPILANIY